MDEKWIDEAVRSIVLAFSKRSWQDHIPTVRAELLAAYQRDRAAPQEEPSQTANGVSAANDPAERELAEAIVAVAEYNPHTFADETIALARRVLATVKESADDLK